MPPLRLLEPSLDLLDRYAAALRHGFAPGDSCNHALMELAAIERDPRGFVQSRLDRREYRTVAVGTPYFQLHRWIIDVVKCDTVGCITAQATRRQSLQGRVDLTIAVAPWWRQRGYADAALNITLDMLRERAFTCVRLRGNIRDDGGWHVGLVRSNPAQTFSGSIDPKPTPSATGGPGWRWGNAA